MAGMAPVLGVYGVSALLLVGAGALVTLGLGTRRERIAAGVVLVRSGWCPGRCAASPGPWPAGPAISVAIVQGAIPEDEKLQAAQLDAQLDTYRDLTRQVLGAQVIVWPEAAVPDTAQHSVTTCWRAITRPMPTTRPW